MNQLIEALFAAIERWGKVAWGTLFWGSVLGAAILAQWPETNPTLAYGAAAALGAGGGFAARSRPGRNWV